jgi:hypothetical protein
MKSPYDPKWYLGFIKDDAEKLNTALTNAIDTYGFEKEEAENIMLQVEDILRLAKKALSIL